MNERILRHTGGKNLRTLTNDMDLDHLLHKVCSPIMDLELFDACYWQFPELLIKCIK